MRAGGAEAEGDIAAWTRFVRRAATVLGRRRAVVALTVTNEANFPVSPNTSDGVYDGVLDAIVEGTVAARATLDDLDRRDVPVGFTVAWRWLPQADRDFWRGIGARATPAFRRALGYVGLQLYPGLVWPPAIRPGRTAGDEVLEAAALVRTCHMPQAGLGPEVPLWITEIGYATNLGRTEAGQARNLRSTADAVHAASGTLGITDLRWFNLRDNDSDGSDLFSAVGLLRDDHSRKPAFPAFREAIARVGTAAPRTMPRRCSGTRRLPRSRAGDRWRRARVRGARGVARLTPRGRPSRVRVRTGTPRGRPAAARRRVRVVLRSRAGRRAVLRLRLRCR